MSDARGAIEQFGGNDLHTKLLLAASLAATAILSSTPAAAALVIDQAQDTFAQGNIFSYGPGFSNLPLGQSITAGMSGRLGAFDIAANRFVDLYTGTAATLTLEIRAGDGLNGTLLGSTTQTVGCNAAADFSSLAGTPCGVRFALTSLGIDVVAGQQYSLLLTGTGAVTGTVFEYGWLSTSTGFGPPANPYAGGQKYAALFPQAGLEDMTFRTLIDTAAGGVPEPSSWALLIAGFGLTGAAMRRRRHLAAA